MTTPGLVVPTTHFPVTVGLKPLNSTSNDETQVLSILNTIWIFNFHGVKREFSIHPPNTGLCLSFRRCLPYFITLSIPPKQNLS